MVRATRERWAELVARWARSGLTAKRFAAKTGINAGTLQYYKWKWQLGRDGRVASTKDSRLKSAVGFVELRARDLVPTEDASAGNRIEVVLARGTRVIVSAGFDAGAFRKVVDALEAPR
jgi:transposase